MHDLVSGTARQKCLGGSHPLPGAGGVMHSALEPHPVEPSPSRERDV